jgi:hypothetical protein
MHDHAQRASEVRQNRPFSLRLLRRQPLQQRVGLLRTARVKPVRKAPVNRSQQFARLLHLATVAPEAREAHRSAQLPRLCLLLPREGDARVAWDVLNDYFGI